MLFQEEAKSSSESRAELEQQLASSTSTVAILQTEKAKLQTEVQESKKEQDDLLMLLADQDQKIHALKQKLRDLGEPVNLHHDVELCLSSQRQQSGLNRCRSFESLNKSTKVVLWHSKGFMHRLHFCFAQIFRFISFILCYRC